MAKLKKLVLRLALTFAMVSVISTSVFAAKPEKPVDWQEEIAQYIDSDYIEYIAETLVGIGAYESPEKPGERWYRVTGTEADHETALFLAEEMEKMGLVDVALEPVPVHTWDFKGASLDILEPREERRTIIATSIAGSPGTGKKGITGELVYVGSDVSGYEGVDVEGKIALANWDGYNIWISEVCSMATKHGAIGIVASCMDSIYAQTPGALTTHDGCYDPDWAPVIYIPCDVGRELRELLETGETVKVKMTSDITLDFDGTGYNVVGYLPGKNYGDPDEELLIVSAHHDAWFTGGADDTGAVANMMAQAKAMADAMKNSSYTPERTIVFTSHTAEEYGYTVAWMDWCIGAWYQITEEHPDWAGRAIACLNHEVQAQRGPLEIEIPRELYPFIQQVITHNQDLLPYGTNLVPEISTWNDQFTFTAAGVPTMTTSAAWGNYTTYLYHTQYDSIEKLDFDYSVQLVEVYVAIMLGLDTATVIPYNFVCKADHLVESLDADAFASAEVDPGVYEPVIAKAEEFLSLAEELQTKVNQAKKNEVEGVNDVLLDVVVKELSNLTAMGVWEDVIYPHEQPLLDSVYLVKAIEELEDAMASGNLDLAMDAVIDLKWWVGMTWYYDYLDYETYIETVVSYYPDYDYWGTQAHLWPVSDAYLEVDSILNKIEAGITDFTDEIGSLTDTLHVARDESLMQALEEMEIMLTDVNAQLSSII